MYGLPGSGKNWFGERLSKKLNIRFYDTDDFSWKKKFTVRRSKSEKRRLVSNVFRKQKWIIGTCSDSYNELEESADVIILLKIGFLKSTYRILSRHVRNKRVGRDESSLGLRKLFSSNIKNQLPSSKYVKHFLFLKRSYPGKVVVLSQRSKPKFLDKQ